MTAIAATDGARPILITGCGGQLGYELLRALAPLGPVHGRTRAELDLTDHDALRRTVRTLRPAAIVNAAAYTAVDRAEAEPEAAARVNGEAPGVLAELAGMVGACFVHYSTDYVFDGTATCPYRESDAPSPTSVYGRTKLAGEQAALAQDAATLVLRTSWVYGTRGHNFLLTMQRLARTGERLRVVNDQRGSPTWSRFIAESTAAILAGCGLRTDRLRERRGLYHLAASGETTWFEFARAIVARPPGDSAVEIEAISTAEHRTAARRPRYSVLDTALLRDAFGLWMPDWSELLARALEDQCKA